MSTRRRPGLQAPPLRGQRCFCDDCNRHPPLANIGEIYLAKKYKKIEFRRQKNKPDGLMMDSMVDQVTAAFTENV